ncbi:MAG: DUF1467 family protein [Rhizobiales bacterium]|nr:DUF1467 family protein [Hyphomicrobiales bacterium]
MSWVSSLAIFFIIWWTALFAVLPFGVRNNAEAGTQVGEGHDAGAPVAHGLRWKLLATTLLSLVIFFGFRFLFVNGYLDVMNLSFLKDAPSL